MSASEPQTNPASGTGPGPVAAPAASGDETAVQAHLAESPTVAASVDPAPAPSPGGALRNPVMRAIVASETISSLGSQITFLALPWFVLVTTGSATRMGLVFAVELLPIALFGLPAGLVVARLGVRRTMLLCDALRVPLVALVPTLYYLDLLSFGVLLGVVFVIGMLTAPYVSAQRLVIPEAFGDNEMLVVQGNGLIEGATRLANLIGPAVAGLLIVAVNPVNVLWIDAASFALSFTILLLGLPKPAASLAAAAREGSTGVFAGARFVLGNPLLRRVSTAALLFGFFFPILLASLPVITRDQFGGDPRVVGLLFAAWGGGAVVGTFGVMRLAQKLPPMRMGALAAIALALPLWLLPLPLSPWQFGLILAACGVFTPMLNAPLITLILLRTPDAVRAQTITFVMTANLLAGPLGYTLAGPALERLGIAPVLLIVAAGISMAALVLVTLIRTDATEAAPAPA